MSGKKRDTEWGSIRYFWRWASLGFKDINGNLIRDVQFFFIVAINNCLKKNVGIIIDNSI